MHAYIDLWMHPYRHACIHTSIHTCIDAYLHARMPFWLKPLNCPRAWFWTIRGPCRGLRVGEGDTCPFGRPLRLGVPVLRRLTWGPCPNKSVLFRPPAVAVVLRLSCLGAVRLDPTGFEPLLSHNCKRQRFRTGSRLVVSPDPLWAGSVSLRAFLEQQQSCSPKARAIYPGDSDTEAGGRDTEAYPWLHPFSADISLYRASTDWSGSHQWDIV